MAQKVAFLFPGQGAQAVGMGRDMMVSFAEAQEIFEQVDTIAEKQISTLCFNGPMEELTLTVNLQPAITAASLACLVALKKHGIEPSYCAGHSLGEYAALVSAGVLSNIDALRLVNMRGLLMHRESLKTPGAMAAILGLDIQTVDNIVEDAKENDVLAIANHNTRDQIVITGERPPLDRAMKLTKDRGGKAVPLKVSGAWHSQLMKDAVEDFRQFMETISFSAPQSTILFNATAATETDPQRMKDIMTRQLISPVKWYDIVLKMLENGVDRFVEVGPNKVLTGLLRKIVPPDKKIEMFPVGDMDGLNRLLDTAS